MKLEYRKCGDYLNRLTNLIPKLLQMLDENNSLFFSIQIYG